MTDVSPTGDGVTQGGPCTWAWVRARGPCAGSRAGGEKLGEKKVTKKGWFYSSESDFLRRKKLGARKVVPNCLRPQGLENFYYNPKMGKIKSDF